MSGATSELFGVKDALIPFSPLYIGVSGATDVTMSLNDSAEVTFSPLYIGVSGATPWSHSVVALR